MSWVTVFRLFFLALFCLSSYYSHDYGYGVSATTSTTSSVSIVGTVFCDKCHENRVTHNSVFLPGATISMQCIAKRMHKHHSSHIHLKTKTDKFGRFKADLPPHFKAKRMQGCKLQLVRSPFESCNIFSKRLTSPSLMYISKHKGTSFFTLGAIDVKPKIRPIACNSAVKPP